MKEKLKNMAKDKTLIHWEALENVRKDGKTIFCDWYVTPLYDSEGNFTGIMSMAIDVTERRKGETALSESENRFRQIFEDSPIGMGLIGLDSCLIMVNPRFCEFIGYSAPELKGKSFVDLTHPEDVHLDMDNWEKLAAGEIPRYEMEKRYIRKDGRLVWGRLLVTLIRDKAGKPLYALGMVEDATATRKAAEVHSQLTAILQQTSDAVIGADLKGRIFSWNRGAEAMLGYSMEEIIGKSTALLVPLDREEEMEKVRELATREENVSNYETVMLKKNEGQVEVSVSVSTLKDPKGKIVGISVISRDITERKKAEASIRHHEEQMRLAQKMEAVGRLASGVAHDFNNLLNVIVGNAEFLVDGMEKGNPHLEEVGEIKKAVWRGAELTKQLLVFGKGQVSKPRPVNLNDLCVEMNKMLKRLIDSTIKPSIIQDKGLKLILIDPGQMQQVILNLVINARDAMPQGGHLIIETKNVDASDLDREQKPTLAPGSYVRLHVTDTGTGMTKETQNRLFEPFFTTKADKGTGLGLATVYAIVKQFKGHIFLKSTLGIGTTFSLYFPALEEVEAVSSLPEPIVLTPRGSETVLLAEDDEPVRKALVRILEKYGYRVLEAGSGKEAIQKAGDEPGSVKLLLTDAIMFEMNGRELADELVKTNPRMRIVFISGYSREILSEQGILHEGNRLIPKPFDVEELMREIRTALDEP